MPSYRISITKDVISFPSVQISRSLSIRNHYYDTRRLFSVLNRPPPNYPGHIPLTSLERVSLALGKDLIAVVGETTASPYFINRLRDTMLASPTGRRILRDRPRISSETICLSHLRNLPENSMGRTYAEWLDREGVSPDTRDQVKYIDDEECAYVMQRYRECHDFYHAITGLPVVVEGEIALKAFEFANTLIPMTALSLFAVTRLKPKARKRFWSIYFPWAIKNGIMGKDLINVYWEEELERDVDCLRKELGIQKPTDLRNLRAKKKI
ncbi:Ubiquinone biosynthesis protein COQ4, mitochondrial [Erysiphe necator]|nr:Ubiquinone biosynthesis protein COQ4, mitochondrial [Erysiphe necator]